MSTSLQLRFLWFAACGRRSVHAVSEPLLGYVTLLKRPTPCGPHPVVFKCWRLHAEAHDSPFTVCSMLCAAR